MANFKSGYLNTGYFGDRGVPIRVVFPQELPNYYNGTTIKTFGIDEKYSFDPAKSFSSFDIDAQNWVKVALRIFANAVNFQWTNGSGDGPKLSFGFTNLTNASGVGLYPKFPNYLPASGDVFLNTDYKFGSFSPDLNLGNRGQFSLLLHEIGHALGLDHDGVSAKTAAAVPLDADEASVLYTITSYSRFPRGTQSRFPVTPMMYDVAQLQAQYGANFEFNKGISLYKFTDTTHPYSKEYGIKALPRQILMTLWDGDGLSNSASAHDVIDASGVTTRTKIDLRPGEFSAIGTDYEGPSTEPGDKNNRAYNVGIAIGTRIESAAGGKKGDTIIGDTGSNRLHGGGGADTLQGGAGRDFYFVGDGADVVRDDVDGSGFVIADVTTAMFLSDMVNRGHPSSTLRPPPARVGGG